MGWGDWAADVVTHDIPGDHASILQSPGVERLAETLRSELARTDERSS